MTEHRPPVCGIARNPAIGIVAADMRAVEPGRSLADLAREFCPAPTDATILLCRLNGEWVSHLTPEQHDRIDALVAEGRQAEAEALSAEALTATTVWADVRVSAGDIVEFHEMPEGNGLRIVAGLAIAAVSSYFGFTPGIQFGLALALGGVIGLLAPQPGTPGAGQAAQAVFSTSLQGNQGRLNQPIWKVCGRRKFFPPFAAMPYQEFVSTNGTDVDNKQYYYALFAATIGNLSLESVQVGGTDVSHLQDILTKQLLAPGVAPTRALGNVESSTLVSGLQMDTLTYVGGFVACKALRTVTQIGIDIECPRGISQQIQWRVEVRKVNDFGTPISAWAAIATETRNPAVTNTPQRWSYRYTLSGGPYRAEVRVIRLDTKNTSATALHDVNWAGMRGYLAQAATLDPSTTHYEIALRGSAQLNQFSQRDFAIIGTGMCRTWSAGVWGSEVATRNPAWWALDCAVAPSSGTWGLGLADARVDIQSFADLAATCDARQDRFDYVFDQPMAAWDALQLIARACRARVFRRNGLLTIARDDLQTIPVTAFTSRNTVPGSIQIVEKLPEREQPDGVIVQYEDFRTWQSTPIECPCPGVVTMTNPIVMPLPGIVGPTHAHREGLYEAAKLLYRTRVASWTTEMEGTLPAFMAAVSIQPDTIDYGQTGDVVDWNEVTLTMTLSEPPAWGSSDLYLRMRRDDGTMTTPVKIVPGPGLSDVILPALPDFLLNTSEGIRERPLFLLGPLATIEEIAKMTSIADGGQGTDGEQLYAMKGIVDDARVHAADNALLPGPGDVQDPITLTQDTDGSAIISLAVLSSHFLMDGNAVAPGINSAAFTFGNNGSLGTLASGSAGSISGEWSTVALTALQAAASEIRFTVIPGGFHTSDVGGHYGHPAGSTLSSSSSATGAWLSLATSRTISVDSTVAALDGQVAIADVLCEIRDATSGLVQASATLTLVQWQALEIF